MSEVAIDNFLLYYAAHHGNLVKDMESGFRKYAHVTRDWPPVPVNYFKSEYIISRVFLKGGLISKFMNHSAIRNLPQDQYAFLDHQMKNPWKFSFAEIADNPSLNFYTMRDVFTQEEYLLYSPGILKTLEERAATLWFNLIEYNGVCWQSFGLLVGFNGFSPDDIYFFATELNPDIQDEADLMETVNPNPIPFFMLLDGADFPIVMHKNHHMAHWVSWDEEIAYPETGNEKGLNKKYSNGVYRLQASEWSDYPHYASAYYVEEEMTLQRYAMTEAGFNGITQALIHSGFSLEPGADIHVSLPMVHTAGKVLRKEIKLNEYEPLFSEHKSEPVETLDAMNRFFELLLPFINEGEEIDIEDLAAKAGIDTETANTLLQAAIAAKSKISKY
jgi:hypothetical protein